MVCRVIQFRLPLAQEQTELHLDAKLLIHFLRVDPMQNWFR